MAVAMIPLSSGVEFQMYKALCLMAVLLTSCTSKNRIFKNDLHPDGTQKNELLAQLKYINYKSSHTPEGFRPPVSEMVTCDIFIPSHNKVSLIVQYTKYGDAKYTKSTTSQGTVSTRTLYNFATNQKSEIMNSLSELVKTQKYNHHIALGYENTHTIIHGKYNADLKTGGKSETLVLLESLIKEQKLHEQPFTVDSHFSKPIK